MAAKKRLLRLQNDFVYFGALGAVIIAQTLVPQPRYFYWLYVLLCLQLAQTGAGAPAWGISLRKQGGKGRAASLLDHNEVALG
jgi:hypothetical protein